MNVQRSSPRRPAGAFIHGTDGPVVLVPASVARWLEQHTNLPRQRVARRGLDDAVDEVLLALRVVAMRASSPASSDAGTEPVYFAEPAKQLELTADQAGDLIGITGRAVRKAIHEHRLAARRTGAEWLITRADAENYRAARAA